MTFQGSKAERLAGYHRLKASVKGLPDPSAQSAEEPEEPTCTNCGDIGHEAERCESCGNMNNCEVDGCFWCEECPNCGVMTMDHTGTGYCACCEPWDEEEE